MARPSELLVAALRATAARLEAGAPYRWSHFGACNCGHLAQTLTRLSPRQIYDAAFARPGDWGEQGREFCAETGAPMDDILSTMMDAGLAPGDFSHLERLDDPGVERAIGRRLVWTERADVVLYLRTWAGLLEAHLGEQARGRTQAA